MIDFTSGEGQGGWFADEDRRVLAGYANEIELLLREDRRNKYRFGVALIGLWESRCYRVTADTVVNSHSSKWFFRYCEQTFDLDKSTVSRLMNVVHEFGSDTVDDWDPRWQPFSYTALVEMLPLTDAQRKRIPPHWSCKRIREFKRELEEEMRKLCQNGGAEPEPDNTQITEEDLREEEPPICELEQHPKFRYFWNMSKADLVRHTLTVELENVELLRIIKENGITV